MNNYEKFTYEGVGKAVKIKDTVPVKIYWKFKNNSGISDLNIKEEVTYMKFPKIYISPIIKCIIVQKIYQINKGSYKVF